MVPLRRMFEETILDDFPRTILEVDTSGGGNGDFKSAGWFEAVISKQRIAYEKIIEHWGGIIILSDIDIQFFGSIKPALEVLMTEEMDMLFQSEHRCPREVNAGFIVMRCNDRVKTAYELLLKEDLRALDMGEQSWFNHYLHRSPLRWRLLPETFYAWSQNPGHPPEGILLHHANCTGGGNSVQKKLQQMETLRKIVKERHREGL